VAVLVGLLMWGAAKLTPKTSVPPAIRAGGAAFLAAAGLAIGLSGVAVFRRAGTTVDPMKPGSASSLVRSGIYRLTRNPMYVGLLLVLLGWAVVLTSPAALVVASSFVLYMNRFQIVPEERALRSRFGAEFEAYRARVRRWI